MNTFDLIREICINWRNTDDFLVDKFYEIAWDDVWDVCEKHNIEALLYEYITNRECLHHVPSYQRKKMINYTKNLESSIGKKIEYFKEINSVLIASGIKATIIKGLSFSRFFPKFTRSFGDIDLIVNPQDILPLKRILEQNFDFRVDAYEYFDFAKDESKIIDGTVDYLHIVFGNEKLWIEAHPATTYWSWANLENFHNKSQLIDGLYLLSLVDCFHMAVAHIWNHNPQHIQHVSHGICQLRLYIDLREIYLHLIKNGFKENLYKSILDNHHVEFAYEALKTCELLFSESLIRSDYPTPASFLDRYYSTSYISTTLETLVVSGKTETDRIKEQYYQNVATYQLYLHAKRLKQNTSSAELSWKEWGDHEVIEYNNYHVPGDYFWPRRTVNYFYQFYNCPIKTKFSIAWSEAGLFLYGESDWNTKSIFEEERFNFNYNYLRFMFGKHYNDKPISILLQAKLQRNSSVFIGEGEFVAEKANGCSSVSKIENMRYFISAYIPWITLGIVPCEDFLFDIITHHTESDLPAMIVWSGGMGSEKMFGCDYFAKAVLQN